METIFDLRSLVEIRARGEEALENVESMGKGQEGVEDGVVSDNESVWAIGCLLTRLWESRRHIW